MQFNIVPFQEKIQHINGIKVLKDNQLAVLSDKGLYLCHFPELAMEKYDFSLPGHDDAAVRKVYQDSKGFLWIFTGLPGIIRLDPETGVKQYLNTPSGYMASSLMKILTEWFGLFLIKVYSVIMTKRAGS